MENPTASAKAPDSSIASTDSPMLYSGEFQVSQTGGTYLDMRQWNFGVVWVNGHNLGRYWNVGADRSLYLPSVWQQQGTNQITLLELGGRPKEPTISGATKLIEEPATQFHPFFKK
jgi:beta-galactosidase